MRLGYTTHQPHIFRTGRATKNFSGGRLLVELGMVNYGKQLFEPSQLLILFSFGLQAIIPGFKLQSNS